MVAASKLVVVAASKLVMVVMVLGCGVGRLCCWWWCW